MKDENVVRQATCAVKNLILAMNGEKPIAQVNPEVPVKKVVKKMRYAWTLLLSSVLFAGCGKQLIQLDSSWSATVKVSDSRDSLVGGVILQKWHDSVIAFQGIDPEIAPLDDVSARCFSISSTSEKANSWTEVPLTGVPNGFIWAYPAIDRASDNVFFEQGYTENDQLVMKAFVGRMAGRFAVRDGKEKVWTTDAKEFFGETGSIIHFTERNMPEQRRRLPGLGLGIINGSDLYIPYCLGGFTFNGKGTAIARGPYNNGVFHSSDSGMTWRMERVSDLEAWLPSVRRTTEHYYYFAVSLPPNGGGSFNLCFARKPVGKNLWDAPKVVTKTFCRSALSWKYVAEAHTDTVHLCWLDNRHEKRRSNLVYPQRENYEIVYSHRKDSDADWSTDVILSAGMLYSYTPSTDRVGV